MSHLELFLEQFRPWMARQKNSEAWAVCACFGMAKTFINNGDLEDLGIAVQREQPEQTVQVERSHDSIRALHPNKWQVTVSLSHKTLRLLSL